VLASAHSGSNAGGGIQARSLGPYTLLNQIGRGSYGAVYLAHHRQSGSRVALKVLLGTPDEETVLRFRREAAITARLQNPAIVRTFDVGRDGRYHYYAMEHCPGPTLKERLRQGPLPSLEAAALVAKLARAVAEAHQWGVIHRDLKPSNVILSEPDGAPKIADFGLARDYAQERLTHTGDLLGTPAYMAPEQFRGETTLDHRVDIYALGVLLYQLLTGHTPYKAATLPELAGLVEAGQARRPREHDAQIPERLEAICLRAMHPDPGKRFLTASSLADALEGLAPKPKQRAARPAAAAPAESASGPLTPVALGGYALAAVAFTLLAWQWIGGAPEPDVAPAPAPPVTSQERTEGELRQALEEVRLQRGDKAPPATIARQLVRALDLASDPELRQRLEAELSEVRAQQDAIDRAQRLVRDLERDNLERVAPEASRKTAEELSAAYEHGLPGELVLPAQRALLRFEVREEIQRILEIVKTAELEDPRDASAILELVTRWSRHGKEIELEALEGLYPILKKQPHSTPFSMLKGIVLYRLGRKDEARQIWSILRPDRGRYERMLHHFSESGLTEDELGAIVEASRRR